MAVVMAILVGAVVFLLAFLYQQLTKNRGHVETMGLPLDKPNFFLGSSPLMLHKHLLHDVQLSKMKKYGQTFVGYEYSQPILSTIDPELIKSITVKHFENFSGIINFEIKDIHTTLDAAGGMTWTLLRKNLSPVFSSGKLKAMLEPMTEVGNLMMEHLETEFEKNSEIDVKYLFQNFALETISQCAFGIKSDAFKNKDSELLKQGREAFASFRVKNAVENAFQLILFHFPVLFSLVDFFPKAYTTLYNLTNDIVKSRESQNITKNDFLGRLQELVRDYQNSSDEDIRAHLTEEIIMAQGVVFFIAGYETTSNTLSTLLYNLAKHPEIQDTVQSEILSVLDEFDGLVNYDSVADMKYLEACINEDLRVMPPVLIHIRQCMKDTEVAPGIMIKKGMRVDFPIYSAHHNPDFFPDPEKFMPERFLPENEGKIRPFTFRPFGGGPRQCIGQRFAMFEMKIAAAKILAKYRVSLGPRSTIEWEKGSTFLMSYPQLVLKFEQI